jgi:hypothetical protein
MLADAGEAEHARRANWSDPHRIQCRRRSVGSQTRAIDYHTASWFGEVSSGLVAVSLQERIKLQCGALYR